MIAVLLAASSLIADPTPCLEDKACPINMICVSRPPYPPSCELACRNDWNCSKGLVCRRMEPPDCNTEKLGLLCEKRCQPPKP